jgi:hypothetical protein
MPPVSVRFGRSFQVHEVERLVVAVVEAGHEDGTAGAGAELIELHLVLALVIDLVEVVIRVERRIR